MPAYRWSRVPKTQASATASAAQASATIGPPNWTGIAIVTAVTPVPTASIPKGCSSPSARRK